MDQWDFTMSFPITEARNKIMTSLSVSRWSLSTIKSEVKNVGNPSISGGLREGKALYIQGVATGESFILDVMKGSDIAFHFRPYINNRIVCNSLLNGYWGKEETIPGCQISKGSAFDIFIVTRTEGYEVFINGQRSILFKHRMRMDCVTAFHIHHDAIVNTFGTIEDWSTSTFGKELNSCSSRTKLSDIQSDWPHPVCSPSKPYFGKIPGGSKPGVALFFQGVVPSDCERFAIDLHDGPDIAFHFNPRMNCVVLNSYIHGQWGHEEIVHGGPFVRGGAFDIIMVIKSEGYEVIVNGLEFYTFKHRISVENVNELDITRDVFINAFCVIEGNVNLKITNPANI